MIRVFQAEETWQERQERPREVRWNAENKKKIENFFPDEVERLLRDYKQNQELLRRLGNRYYQVVYPIQVRQLRPAFFFLYKWLQFSNNQARASHSYCERGEGQSFIKRNKDEKPLAANIDTTSYFGNQLKENWMNGWIMSQKSRWVSDWGIEGFARVTIRDWLEDYS